MSLTQLQASVIVYHTLPRRIVNQSAERLTYSLGKVEVNNAIIGCRLKDYARTVTSLALKALIPVSSRSTNSKAFFDTDCQDALTLQLNPDKTNWEIWFCADVDGDKLVNVFPLIKAYNCYIDLRTDWENRQQRNSVRRHTTRNRRMIKIEVAFI